MARQRTEFVGRGEELDALRCDRGVPALKMVRGATGSGKSALLKQASAELTASGVLVLEVACSIGHPEWDQFGVQAILGAVREKFESFDPDPRLADAISAVSRLCVPTAYISAWSRFSLLHALHGLFSRLRANGPLALMIDDVDRLPQPLPTLSAVHRAGHLIVASRTGEPQGEPTELEEVADRTVDLGPLPADDLDSVLRLIARAPVDETLRAALRGDLGPLYGNPGTLVSTMADLRARGRLVRVHAHLCLRESNEPIALADDHPQLAEVAALGELARALAALSCGADGFRVDELPLLAAATGHSTAECGQVADRLVRAGVLDNDRAGFLRCRSRALGNAVTRQLGKDEIQRFHRSIAEQLLDAGDLSTRFTAALASHVAEAGSSMAPRPELAELLSDTVCTALDPSQRAVYLYAAWWHSEAGVARTSLCSQLVRLLVRCAGYARLAEFVAEVVADERSGSALSSDARAELATAAALAAIHCGRPLSEPVRTALTCSEGVPDPIGFCDRWFGEEAIDWCDISSAFAPVWLGKGSSSSAMGRRRHRQGDVTVEMAFAVRNLVPVFEAVLGPDYQVPDDGPVAAYHRVCHGYAQGEWSAALSAARELRLVNADPESRHRASLLAAEMCGWRGEDRQASEWLASVPEDAFPVLRGWAASGLRYHDGDLTGAIEQGWEAYRREGREGAAPGSSRLLRRLAGIAMEAGQSYWSRRLLAEVEVRHDRLNTAESFETVSYVRSLIGVPGASPHDSERTVRLRGNRFELALACQVMGSTSDRPHSWLREAYDVALGVGASRLIARTKRALEECGGAVPSTRVRQDHLTENDLRIIALIRMGKTNRQIALELRTSEKSVARYLTRLYVKAGCRTRHGLATSGLGSSLEQVGA